nr:retrovirus-related Pol polyprotein from transposon TNT 1-94 [Tanacetum cinerariifolium]
MHFRESRYIQLRVCYNIEYFFRQAIGNFQLIKNHFHFFDLCTKYYVKIRVLEFKTESRANCIESLTKDLELLKKEKGELKTKLTGFQTASKDLDSLLESQRLDKNKEGLGYSVVPPPPAQVYSPPKKGMSWTGLPEFKDDTITDYSRPSPDIESTSDDAQNRNPSETEASPSTISPKPFIKPPMRPIRSNMNDARLNRTSFNKPAHSYTKRPFQRTSAVRSQYRALWVPTVNRKFSTVNRKFLSGSTKFSTADMGKKGNTVKASAFPKTTLMTKAIGTVAALGIDFKLLDDANGLLRSPRQHNMYSINLNNNVPHKDLTCLVAKASADEGMLWHKRLGNLNFKTMNRLVRHNLVRGLPSKCFENDYTCTACLKGRQHKVSCKSKLVNSVTKPLHTLYMDLFGPTSVSTISHKWYCLVVTDDFSRLTWTFFLKTKDETSGILRKFITEIENLKNLKVKIIRCDNGGEFINKEMDDFCLQKGIKREFSNARTPQQNGVAERRNRTLIEATRTMLADAKLPVTFWAEAVNTACYVQNRVLVNKSHSKTPYELFIGRSPAIGFLKPFGCHVMILNTLDHLGKFEAKGDEGYFIGYSMSTKAFRVQILLTFQVQRMQQVKNKPQDDYSTDVPESSGNSNPTATSTNPSANQMETLTLETPIPTVSLPVPTACFTDSQEPSNPSWVEAMQEDLLQFKIQNVWTLVNFPKGDLVPARVYKVEKAMYGLHQAPRAWQRGNFILVQVYVDDIIFGSSNLQLCREFEALMHEKFQMSDMGELNFFLGLQVLPKEDGIFLSQDNMWEISTRNLDIHMSDRLILPWTRRILGEKKELGKM